MGDICTKNVYNMYESQPTIYSMEISTISDHFLFFIRSGGLAAGG